VMQWQNKELKVVWPLEAKTANLIFPAPPYEKR